MIKTVYCYTVSDVHLPIVENEREDAKLRKSVSAGYASDLINIVVHYSDSVDFLKKHGLDLLTLGEQGL